MASPKIIVSLTSIKSRENALRETLATLIAQDISSSYEVRVYLSREPYLLDEGFSDEPDWIHGLATGNSNCTLKVYFVRNTGPYRKLMPVLEEFIDSGMSVVIVTCDDDTHYDTSWLRTLLHYDALTSGLVAFRGHTAALSSIEYSLLPYASWQSNHDKFHYSLGNLPTGKDGVVYRPYYFDRSVLDVDTAMRIAPTADDLWFRWHTILRGVPCYLINLQGQTYKAVPSFEQEMSLWQRYNKNGGNDLAIDALETRFHEVFGTSVANELKKYVQALNATFLPSFDAARRCLAKLAARQVRMHNTMLGAPVNFRSVCAMTYEYTFLALRSGVHADPHGIGHRREVYRGR